MPATIQIQLDQLSASATGATIRNHRLQIDRPESKGGNNSGPMGGELFLAAVGGCFMSNLLAAIQSRNAQITEVHTTVVGTLEESPARFSAIELQVQAQCPDPQLFEKLVEIAERGCIMVNTLRSYDCTLRIKTGPALDRSSGVARLY
jgi:putative redox protein